MVYIHYAKTVTVDSDLYVAKMKKVCPSHNYFEGRLGLDGSFSPKSAQLA